MRDIPFLALMGWDATAMRGGAVTKVTLSDQSTEVPFSETLKTDILKAIESRTAERPSIGLASAGGSSAA